MFARLAEGGGVLGAAARRLYVGHGTDWAAALAYYSLLSVFPAALLGATAAATFVDGDWAAAQIVGAVGRLLPTVSHTLAIDVREAIHARGRIGVAALAVLVWTGSRVFSTLTIALDEALGRPKSTVHPGMALLREVGLMIAAGTLLVGGTLLSITLEIALDRIALPAVAAQLLVGVARLAFFFAGQAALLAFLPTPRPRWGDAWRGALAATALLVIAMPLFSAYVSRIAQYNLIYGPVAILIIVLVWFWLASLLVLFGANVTAELEGHEPVRGAPPPPAAPLPAEAADAPSQEP